MQRNQRRIDLREVLGPRADRRRVPELVLLPHPRRVDVEKTRRRQFRNHFRFPLVLQVPLADERVTGKANFIESNDIVAIDRFVEARAGKACPRPNPQEQARREGQGREPPAPPRGCGAFWRQRRRFRFRLWGESEFHRCRFNHGSPIFSKARASRHFHVRLPRPRLLPDNYSSAIGVCPSFVRHS